MGPVVPAAGPSKRTNRLNMWNLLKRMDLRRAQAARPWMAQALQAHPEPMAVPSARPDPSLRASRFAMLALATVLALTLTLGGVVLWSTPAQAQTETVLIQNTGQTAEAAALPLTSSNPWRAQAFTTGSNSAGYTLSSIGFDFASITDTMTAGDQLEVTISSDSSDEPGAELCTLTDPATFSGSGVHTFDAPSTDPCPTLAVSTKYFAVIKRVDFSGSPTPTISLHITAESNEDAGGATGWSIEDTLRIYTGSTWVSSSSRSYRVVVRGEADNNPATGAPSISGAAREGVALAAGVSDISDTDGLTGVSYAYQWEREDGGAWGAITGATAQHYYVSAADIGKALRVVVRFTDDADNAESATSAATDAVTDAATINVVWSATLTVAKAGNEYLYSDGTDATANGGLSPATFSLKGNTYTVHELNNNAGAGDISLLLSAELPTAFTLLHAPSGTRASSATDAAEADGDEYRYTWNESDTLWSDGDQVAVAVQVVVNNPPAFDDGAMPTRTLPENSGAGVTITGGVVAATDADSGDTLTYSLASSGDHGSFEIDSNGQISTKTGVTHNFNFEASKNSYSVTVNVRDSKDAAGNADTATDDTIAVTIDLTNVNDAPEITTSATTANVAENTTAVFTLAASDEDASETQTWSVESGDDGNKFEISSSGVLSFTTAPDFEIPADADTMNDYDVTVKVADAGGLSDTHTVSVTVTNVNEAPEITTTETTVRKDENETHVILVQASDVDASDTLNWSVESADDGGKFKINTEMGTFTTLSFKNAPNFEMPTDVGDTAMNNAYVVTLKITDAGGLSGRHTFTVEVNDVNEAPEINGAPRPSFVEIEYDATSPDLTIGTYTYEDEDRNPADTITWGIKSLSADAEHFNISGSGVLSFNMRPDFENPFGTDNEYLVEVQADDGQGGVGTFPVIVDVTNMDETPEITTTAASHTAPSFVEIEYDATMENLVVAEYEARDEEEQIIAWSRTGADAGDFSIEANTGVLSFAQRPNFEMPADGGGDNVYNITVRARDTASNTRELEVVVTVTDVNERPDINEDTVPSYVEIEYDFTGTLPDVHTFTATDYDDMDTFEWSLVGTDAAYLDIGAASGILTFTQNACANDGPLPDFEEPCDDDGDGSNTYSIIVVATDDDATDQKFSEYAVVVAVTDVNEAPEFTGTPETALTLDEHDANTDYVVMDLADYDARDEELGVTWSLTGTDRGDFAISADGVVTFAETPNYEEPEDSGGNNVYEFTVVATDVQSGSSRRNVSQAVTVTVGDVEEAGTVTVDNLSPAVSQTLTFSLTDPDGGIDLTVDQNLGSAINWRLESQATGGSWTQVVGLSFEVSTTFRYTVDEDVTGEALRAVVTYVDRRGSGKMAVSEETAAVTPDPIANAPPRFRGGSIWNVEEGPADRAIGPRITATDRDNDTLTYGIQSGQDAASFEINPSTGQVRLVEALDFEPTSDPLRFTVTVHDGRDSDGNPEDPPVIDDTITISFFVLDVEEDGVVTLSTQEAETGTPLITTFEDGDGGVTGEVWQWARSRNGRTGWTNISGATSSSYTPTVADEDFFLRATVTYTDRRGAGKSAAAITGRRVPSENRRPTFPSTEDGQRTVAENTRAGRSIGAAVVADDPEGDSLTYSLSGSDAAAFTVVRSTGQIRTSEALDFETKSGYSLTVEVHDGRDGIGNASTVVDDTQAVTITVENEEELGVVTLATDTGTIQARAEVTATLEDDDGVAGSVGWQWARSPNGRTDWVNIAGATSAAYTPTLEEDRGNYIRATATYSDGEGSNKTANAVSRRVGDPPPVNSAPVFPSTENGRREVAENSTDGTAVGDPVAATDLNAGDSSVNDPLVYSLTGTDAASFAIDAGTGQIRLAADVTLDYEGKRTYRVTVEVTDGRDQHGDDDMDAVDDRQNVTITVTDVNEAPVVTGDDEPSYEEGSNRAIATYTAADPERDTLTWSVTNDTEFWISQRGQLYFRTPPSYEVQMSYSVTVTATDDDATTPLAGTLDVAVTVTDAEEEGMVTIEPPRGWDGTIFEAVLDDDDGVVSGETWQWARSSNRSRWADILGATSSSYTATSADENQYLQLTVSYTDRRHINKTASAALTGRIGDSTDRPTVNTLPEFTEDDDDDIDNIPTTTRRVASGAAAGRPVGRPVRATDEDTGEVLTYSLDGTDASLFDIDPDTGQILTRAVLDYDPDGTNSYSVQVRVHDGYGPDYQSTDVGVDATIEVTITVTAVAQGTSGGGGGGGPANRPPVFEDADGSALTETARVIAEDAALGANVGEPVIATDPDEDTLTYSLGGDDAASFAVDPATGQLTTNTALDHEAKASYSVTVTATDPSGATAEVGVTITVTEVVVFDCSSGDAVADAADNPGLVADCEALLKSRDQLVGTVTLNWSEDTSIAEWDGVRLGGTPQRVTQLYLVRQGLDGTVPGSLGSLTGLTGLYLHHNELTGPIPPQLGELSSLVHLTLHRNRLSGEMPAALGDLTDLTFLSLYRNNLTGELPAELGSLSSLRWLYLHSNKSGDGGGLSGPIPAAFGDLQNLERLLLYGNSFSGAMPAELGGLSNLKSLLLHDNELTGRIPSELGDLSSLRYLWLDDNDLSGPIPSELGDLSSLRWLSLYGNALSGAIPAELGDLSGLRLLILDRNDLSGAIPARLGGLSELTWLDLNDNDLSGPIPSELGEMSNLEHLYLHDNDLSGAVPADLGRLSELTNLWLRDNRLSGQIPASLGELPNLQRVRISGNAFTGCVPAGLLGELSWYSDAEELGLLACGP